MSAGLFAFVATSYSPCIWNTDLKLSEHKAREKYDKEQECFILFVCPMKYFKAKQIV
jgi:hypothetical protein